MVEQFLRMCDELSMLLSKITSYFKARRESLMKANPSSAFIFPAAEEVVRNPDVTYPFRQESNFYYLSGFDEPESVLLLVPSRSSPGNHRMVMFVRKRDRDREMWEGERYGIDGVQQV